MRKITCIAISMILVFSIGSFAFAEMIKGGNDIYKPELFITQ
ncbi:hypothetical protein [Paramaledivibacter caminithermalis]|jgi:hypothetical protein|uniref:Uncharacterized protein n=1 Tax=Paramaledivibacter caminithermalis (strain DSM 15212 / CIP 107654 / DViRD3) TaxID=1121301 RepID=A0A1M6M9V5_PARC5|nr:hypothetical protein [Paramaledivibacter caminithermalis]SHJ80258.1 hypothetical protein SAMN02745912_01157 [Paramaledivibacter caminithermalis DSM 15212]